MNNWHWASVVDLCLNPLRRNTLARVEHIKCSCNEETALHPTKLKNNLPVAKWKLNNENLQHNTSTLADGQLSQL